MKKVLTITILLMIMISSCRKDISTTFAPTTVNTKQKTQLKNWFDSHKKVRISLQSKDAADSFILPEQIPIWDSTIYYPDGKVYTTPLQSEGDGITNVTRSLVLHVDENGNVVSGEYTFIRLTNAPDNLSIDQVLASYPKVFEFTDMPDNFKASMLKYDLDGNIIFAKHFDHQVITETNEKIKTEEKAPLANPIELCIYTWWVTYEISTGIILSQDLLSSICSTPGSGGGTGGGGTSEDPNNNTDGAANICKSSFPFNQYIQTSNGVGGWQVAGTIGIHMQIVDLTTGQYVPLYLPVIYFGLPIIRAAGEYFSAETASGISADAVEYAESKVMEYYHTIGGAVNVAGITLYYRQKMNEYMAEYGGAATLQSGSNINVSQLGTATYGWPLIGC